MTEKTADRECSDLARLVVTKLREKRVRRQEKIGMLRRIVMSCRLWSELRQIEHVSLRSASEALSRLQRLVDQAPFDRTLLLTFARICERCNCLKECWYSLKFLLDDDPDDMVVLRGMARLLTLFAQEEPSYGEQALQYWRVVDARSRNDQQGIREITARLNSRMYSMGYLKQLRTD